MSTLYEDNFSFGAVVEKAYVNCKATLDDLPYTATFESHYTEVAKTFPSKTKRDVLHHLMTARKSKKLPATGLQGSPAIHLASADKVALIEIVTAVVGSIGARDQLPYTDKFDRVAAEFTKRTGHNMPFHELWRAIAHLSKSPEDR